MSHIAKFNLKIAEEQRLRSALTALGCTITEGSFHSPFGSYNRGSAATIDSHGNVTKWDNKPVVFGFSMKDRSGKTRTELGFTRANDGSLELVGDSWYMGLSNAQISNAIDNSYTNEGVNVAVPLLEQLGFTEDMTEQQLQLQHLG